MYSLKKASEKLHIKESTLKWHTQRFERFLSKPKGKGSKRYTAEDLAVLKKISELKKHHTLEEIDAMLDVTGEGSDVVLHRSDSVAMALDTLSSNFRAERDEASEEAATKALKKFIKSLGSDVELHLWIDQQFEKHDIKSDYEARVKAKQIYKQILKRWKDLLRHPDKSTATTDKR